VAPLKRVDSEAFYSVGRLTFEAAPGQTRRVLDQDGGFRWGASLRVWGLQVPKADIATAIDMSPDNPEHVAAVHGIARAAWLLGVDVDMNALGRSRLRS
jgi:hypothetical protein